MSNALKFLENENGPTTVGMLFRAYRTRNDLTQDELADILKVGKSLVSDIENDRKSISISKCIEYAKKMKESLILYVKVWFEQSLREEEVNVAVEVKPIAAKVALRTNSRAAFFPRQGVAAHQKIATKKSTKKIAQSTRKKVYAGKH